MGCQPSHELEQDTLDSEGSMETRSELNENGVGSAGPGHRVHWEDSESELYDYGTEYTAGSRVQSSYGSRLMSARGPRARIGSAATGISELFDNMTDLDSQILELDEDEEAEEGEPGIRAPSLALWYNDSEVGDILTQDVYVPAHGLTKHTYYCCLQWNAGMNGGGYCGIQDHPKGRNYIFSLWDPEGTDEKIQPIYTSPDTLCEPFGGEGEGLKTWNFTLGWEPDCWYTLVTRRWDHGDHTYFGFWVKHQMEMNWTHIVTIDYPLEDIFFETLSCSFLEDWEGSGENVRRVHFKNGYKRGLTGAWMPFNQAALSVVKELASKKYEDNINCGVLDDTFFLQAGGETYKEDKVDTGMTLESRMPSKPDVIPICCYITSVTDEEITWEIPSGSVPQFQYIVYVDKVIYKQEINSQTRLCRFRSPPQDIVELLVEDIYGKAVRSQFKVQEEEVREKFRRRCDIYVPTAAE